MKNHTVVDKYRESDVTDCFEVKFEFDEYRVKLSVKDSYGEPYLSGVKITLADEGDDGMFVFDVSRKQHLELAAAINERVCELLERNKQPAPSKVSGKRTLRSK